MNLISKQVKDEEAQIQLNIYFAEDVVLFSENKHKKQASQRNNQYNKKNYSLQQPY